MKTDLNTLPVPQFTRREGLVALVGSALTLAGCGGGGGSGGVAGVNSGGTGAFSSGVVTGLGSIIVNGVRFDDSAAVISDDDGLRRTQSDLTLGLVVSINSSRVSTSATGSTATAQSVTFGSELKGPIDSIGAQSMVVLGQTVNVNDRTVFELGLAGLSALAVGNLVEVHGLVDTATNTMTATRIEKKSNVTEFKLMGQVSAFNATAKTFNIGSLTIGYAAMTTPNIPAALANGVIVRVRLQITPVTGTRTASRITTVRAENRDFDEAELQGLISAFTSVRQFSVNGTPVDATNATFPNGSTGVVLGARVEVEGRLNGGTLIATKVKLEDEATLASFEFELHGTISALNTSAKTFTVRGVVVNYGGTVRFDKGTPANLANGVAVEVRGTFSAATSSVLATRISFET